MTNKEILEKAIQKAIDGGWKVTNSTMDTPEKIMGWYAYPDSWYDSYSNLFIFNHDFAKALWGEEVRTQYDSHYIPARGYPGEPIPKEDIKDDKILKNWDCTRCGAPWKKCLAGTPCNLIVKGNTGYKYHLQQMVISEDPIKYLGDNI